MDKKGQLVYFFMMGIVIIILGLAFAPVLQEFTTIARNDTTTTTIGLNCTNPSIGNFDKATCIITDLNLFYFIGALVMIGLAIIGGYKIFK